VVGAEDRPADLGLPTVRVGIVVGVVQVVLAQRPVDADLVRGGVGAQVAVGEVDVGQRPVVGDDSQLRPRHGQRHHPADGADGSLDRDEQDGFAAVVPVQLTGEQAPAAPGPAQPLGLDGGVQFAQRALPPRQDVRAVDDLPDGGGGGGGHRPVLDRRRGRGALQQVAQRADGLAGPRQFVLQPVQVGRYQRVAGPGVGGGQDGLHVGDGHAQIPQAADDLGRRDLLRPVVPVAGVRVDLGRFQQADLVVVAQRLDAQVRHPGEVPDRDSQVHTPSLIPPPKASKIYL
jgi:hypothetical protein